MHIFYIWTDAAIQDGKRRQVKTIEELQALFAAGSVANLPVSSGDLNPFIAGLKPTHAIINCPVTNQPKKP